MFLLKFRRKIGNRRRRGGLRAGGVSGVGGVVAVIGAALIIGLGLMAGGGAMTAAPAAALAQGQGQADGGDISVSRQGVENRFPDGLRFYIDAESSGSPIEEIRVYVRKLGQSSRSVYRPAKLKEGQSVSWEAMFKSQEGNEYIPTGTRLSYYFDIRTEDGGGLETEPEITVYLNRGLEWESVSDGLINVYYYRHNRQSEGRAQAVLEVAADTYELMQPILGVELTEPMNIVVYSDYDDMRAALRPSSQVAAEQLRTLGQAFTNERTLLVDGSSDLFSGDNTLTTAAHEFTHLLVADAAGSAYRSIHTWLNEGLAVYSEQNPDSQFDSFLNAAIASDSVPPLSSLRTYAGTPRETLRNYGVGHSVATYMVETYGAGKMAALFAGVRETRNMERTLESVYGLTIHELDNEWRRSVGLGARDLATPAPPPLQAIPTRRPTPPPAPASDGAQGESTPVAVAAAGTPARPTYTPRATYTPLPAPTRRGGGAALAPTDRGPSMPAKDRGSGTQPPLGGGGGCSAPAPTPGQLGGGAAPETASLVLLAAPAGLLALAALRRRRGGGMEHGASKPGLRTAPGE